MAFIQPRLILLASSPFTVISTSSVAAVEDQDQAGPFTRTDDDWDTYSPKQCEEKGDKASGVDMYFGKLA